MEFCREPVKPSQQHELDETVSSSQSDVDKKTISFDHDRSAQIPMYKEKKKAECKNFVINHRARTRSE